MNLLTLNLTGLFILFSITTATAQNNMEEQYEAFYEESSTWQEYKMIKEPRLTEFWQEVSDTLQDKRRQIIQAKNDIADLNAQIQSLNTQLQNTQESLNQSESLNDSISFLGVQMSKMIYNIVVWLIIAGLIAAIAMVYLMFKRGHVVTREAKEQAHKLEVENNELRTKSRETQIKLKRELQTALNKLSEQRV